VLKCHAGCRTEDIVAELGLNMKDLFDEPLRPKEKGNGPDPVVATYIYVDEKGTPIFEVRRTKAKQFYQAQIEPGGRRVSGPGCMKGVRRVPYRLRELIAAVAAGDPIFIVEGEKDADRIHELDLVATCNAGGAGKWRDEDSSFFKGATDARIVADADKAGYKHAIQERDSLRRVGIEPKVYKTCAGKDVSEMLDFGYALDDLIEINPGAELEKLRADTVPCNNRTENDTGAINLDSIITPVGLIVPRLADYIAPARHVRLGLDHRLYRYDGGVYRPDGDAFVRARTRELLGEKFKRRHVDEVVAWFRSDHPSVSGQPPLDVVNVANGLLKWSTGDLLPHSPDRLSVNQIPVNWNPGARCDRIHTFLLEVLPEDTIELAYEVIGYSLYAGNPFRVAVLLLGPGRNGKTVLLVIIRALLGPENVSSVPLQAISENRFAAAELFGRLANVCGDLDARAVRNTDTFKMLTGGDPILAERKHRDPFTFTATALPLFSANEAPLSSDQSEAWFDRWVIVPMENRIDPEKVDPHLARRLTVRPELEGLLVRAAHGLRQLMERGRFDLPESVREAGHLYRERLDTVKGFVSECCVMDMDAWTKRKDLYDAYREWVQGSGRHALGAPTFYDHLRRGYPERLIERSRHGVRGFAGIRRETQGEPTWGTP
jgi:putative DNA primase/helicase